MVKMQEGERGQKAGEWCPGLPGRGGYGRCLQIVLLKSRPGAEGGRAALGLRGRAPWAPCQASPGCSL